MLGYWVGLVMMPAALLLVKLVLLDRMVSMYRVCRWFGYLLLSVFWVLESFSVRPRQLVHCPAFINKQQGERVRNESTLSCL